MSLTKIFFGGQRSRGRGYKKLTQEDVDFIRLMVESGKMSKEDVIDKYGISKSTYYNIINGKTWKITK